MQREIRLHLRVFGGGSIQAFIKNAQAVFQPAGISLNIKSRVAFRASRLSDVDLGTSELDELRLAEQFPKNEVPVYFLQSLTPPMNGAAFPDPLIVVTEMTTPWTLAHEIGHALGLEHRVGGEVVMGTTDDVQSPPPDFSEEEIEAMLRSPLLFAIETEAFMGVTREAVLAVLRVEEPDYERGVGLGAEALPHLAQMVEAAEEAPSIAAKAVYLAAKIGGAQAAEIVTSGAAPHRPRPVRIAAAASAAFLPSPQSDAAIGILLDEKEDHGLRKTTYRSIRKSASAAITERLGKIAAEESDPVLKQLAEEAFQRQQ